MSITIQHDNGNQVVFSNRAVYVRQHREYFDSDGQFLPGVGEAMAAAEARAYALGQNRAIAGIAEGR